MDFDWLDWFNKVATNFAFIGAAYVAYLRYFKGRLYKVRLEPTIDCTVISEGDTTQLLVSAKLSNVGLIGAPIPKDGFFVEVLSPAKAPQSVVIDVKWESQSAFPVFAKQNMVEVGECVREELLLSVPKVQHQTLKLRLKVDYQGHKWSFAPEDKGSA